MTAAEGVRGRWIPWRLLPALFLAGHAVDAYETNAGAAFSKVHETAFAGSSINVVAGNRQPLVSHGEFQFVGFYDDDGRLMLGRREHGTDAWETVPTGYRADVADAHNTVSLGVDGDGYLHVAWNHHNVPLHYVRSVAPHSLELGEREAMLGADESRVTYPQFFPLPEGDLLFLYRDGGSGDGSLVLNRYDRRERNWRRVQDRLIDGEGERSAYWDLTVDVSGTLHLAWNWRETPDVASNHDLAYARSSDGGQSWTRSDGSAYVMPITASTAEYALRISQGSNLMNPPAVAADASGQPYIANYWSSQEGVVPRFHIVLHDGDAGWRVLEGPEAAEPFTLSGMGTKRPPWSRAVLLVKGLGDAAQAHLVYRNDAEGQRVMAASLPVPEGIDGFRVRALTADAVGAWEPTFDPVRWREAGELNLLLQQVEQRDGDDQRAASVPGSPIGILQWTPGNEREHHPGR